MKNTIIAYLLLLGIFCIASPLSADKIRHESDQLDESLIVNGLEMDVDSYSGQDSDEDISGEIIFDNSFTDSGKKSRHDVKSARNNVKIINKLRSEDRRCHLVEYRVKANDSIWGISKKFETTISVIVDINDLQNPEQIREGELILVPSKQGIYYTIKKGDTLTSISRKFKSEITGIAELNSIDGSDITAGKKIFIPGADIKNEPVAKKSVIQKKNTGRKDEPDYSIAANKNSKTKKAGIVLTWPLSGPVTSGFGYRKDPFSGNKRFHCGMDIGAEIGTPVKAAGNGKVIFSGWKGAYGYLVVIAHEKNYITVYAHNSKNLVKKGETIKKGEVVALSGNTGAVTGAHLHFEIRKGTVPLNPRRLLKK